MADPAPSGFSQRQRRVFVVVFGVVCAALALGYYLFLLTDYAVLYTGLKPSDAAAIVAELDTKGISHRLRDDGTTILVPTDQTDTVRLAVAGSDIPMKGAVGFELFNKSDMGLTDFAQKINYQRALQGELARTIMSMEGIDSARVHLAIPERSLYRGDHATPKAAVEVVAKIGRPLTPDRVAGIQQLIASAVPDLPLSEVSILDGDGRIISTAPVSQAVTTPELEERAATQAYYSARAKAAVAAQVPGLKFDVRTLVLTPFESGDAAVQAVADRPGTERNFQLRVTVVTLTALSEEEQARARDAVARAVGLDVGRGDAISFELGPIQPPAAAPPRIAPRSVATVPPPASIALPQSGGLDTLGWVTGLCLVLATLGFVLMRARRSDLSHEDRAAFIERLRAELRSNGSSDVRA
ncbi:flagellar M-ring protein FliF [Sphingomonas sp. HMWF008]|nr:flagellar M-ring protein FliF [Sphingomonas sp. HMWF008]